LYIKKV